MISSGLGLYLATVFVAGVSVQTYPDSSFLGISFDQNWKFLILFGIILGLLNYFVKPILHIITLPLRIITLGLFGFVVNMALIWVVDYAFKELSIPWFFPLLWTTLIIFGLNLIIVKLVVKED